MRQSVRRVRVRRPRRRVVPAVPTRAESRSRGGPPRSRGHTSPAAALPRPRPARAAATPTASPPRPGPRRPTRSVCARTRADTAAAHAARSPSPWPTTIFTDSIAAHRTRREPCLVIRPRCTVVSDSWCDGYIAHVVVRLLWFLTLDKPETLRLKATTTCASLHPQPAHGSVSRAPFHQFFSIRGLALILLWPFGIRRDKRRQSNPGWSSRRRRRDTTDPATSYNWSQRVPSCRKMWYRCRRAR